MFSQATRDLILSSPQTSILPRTHNPRKRRAERSVSTDRVSTRLSNPVPRSDSVRLRLDSPLYASKTKQNHTQDVRFDMDNTLHGETSPGTCQVPRPSALPEREPLMQPPPPPGNSNEREPSSSIHTTGMDTQTSSANENLSGSNQNHDGSNQNSLNSAEEVPAFLPKLTESLEFVRMVKNATLESQLCPEDLDRLRNPSAHSSTPSDDPDLLLSISCFIDLMNSSQDAYDKICENIRKRDPTIEMLSYARVKRAVQNLSGIVALEDDMCVNTCVAFTGPYAGLENCPAEACSEPRYDQDKYQASGGKNKVARRKFTTFPPGPQIQARWNHPETAEKMLYRQRQTAAGADTGSYNVSGPLTPRCF